MRLNQLLRIAGLRQARLVAGEHDLDRQVRGIQVVDIPDPAPWVKPGYMLLTTGFAWPREEVGQRALIRALAARDLAAVGLAVPNFFDRFPEGARAEADAAGLPSLEIPWHIPFAEISQQVQEAVVAEQHESLARSEAIHRALTRAATDAGSLKGLAETLSDLTKRGVIIESGEGQPLAWAGEVESYWSGGNSSRQGWPPASGFGPVGGPPHLPPACPGPSERVACPISLRGELMGRLLVLESSCPLTELDIRAAEHASVIAALHIAHEKQVADAEARLGYAFLDLLLEGRFEATVQNVERARVLGFDPDAAYRIGMVVLDERLPLSREGLAGRESYVRGLARLLADLGRPSLVSVSLNQVFFLLPEKVPGARVWDRVKNQRSAMALSRLHTGPGGPHLGYAEVQAVGPHLTWGTLSTYEQLLIPRIFSGDREAQDAFLEDVLGPLRQARRGQALIDSVVAMACAGFRRARAAGILHVHPNTLRYRLQRSADLMGVDLEDAETRFRIRLAAQLLSLRDSEISDARHRLGR
ncbi:MAG: PucR family transcriptional regulator [Chloroflexota bacterium]